MNNTMKQTRHILSLSGGKDSTALAIHMRNTRPEIDMEYVFCDTQKELTETYEYLNRVEAFWERKLSGLMQELDSTIGTQCLVVTCLRRKCGGARSY